MSRLKRSLKDVIKGEKKKAPNPEGEKAPCSSKDKDQPQRNEASKGTDRDTSKDKGKRKGDEKKDEAADQGTSKDKEKTKEDEKKYEAAGPLEQILQNLHQMQLSAGTENNNTTLTGKLKTIASDKGFRISDNQGSGNCMFHALSEQLETIKGIKIQHGQLRQSLVQYLRKNSRLPNGTDLYRFVDGHETWANYLTYMEQDGTWGDHVILCAAANYFKTCIHVVSSLNNDVVIRPHGLVDESKPLVLGHIDEVHYVSLQPIKDQHISKDKGKRKGDEKKDEAADRDTSKDKGKIKGDEKKDEAAEKAPNTSLKRERIDGNEQTKSVQGGTYVSEDNKELNQLHSGERDSNVTEMKLTLPPGFSVDSRDATGRTPLMNAALNGNVQVVKSIMKRGADPSLMDNRGWNTLHLAAQSGDTHILSLIHSHLPNIESKTGEGYTPLMVAAAHCKLHAVKWFLEKGATVACECNRGWNTLHCAAQGGDTDIISLIHTHLPIIESKTGEGYTPLMVAALTGKLHAVKWFLEKGATVAGVCNRGWNTLHLAAQGGDTDVISLIHTLLPNIESKTGEGYTPLMVAAFRGKLHAVKWFLEKGATVACECNRGRNTLHCAAQGGDTDIISLIHTHLPNIESKTGDGHTPLMVAAFAGKLHAVKWFLEKGATVACENNTGWNVLHLAAFCSDPDIIDLILTHLSHVPGSESTTGND